MGAISYSVDEEILIVKLLSICPPKAIRPYFQEGFLAGSYPSSEQTRSDHLDMARRLVAKFRINHKKFEDRNFTKIPHDTLYPAKDVMKDVCEKVKQRAQGKVKNSLAED